MIDRSDPSQMRHQCIRKGGMPDAQDGLIESVHRTVCQ